ncbi:hypothetical protein AX17_007520 [Amanita inopinata Kibby_2008]|nr:hypothetical protein AX17_007520 [Amanita inopinata Kibby_2008]
MTSTTGCAITSQVTLIQRAISLEKPVLRYPSRSFSSPQFVKGPATSTQVIRQPRSITKEWLERRRFSLDKLRHKQPSWRLVEEHQQTQLLSNIRLLGRHREKTPEADSLPANQRFPKRRPFRTRSSLPQEEKQGKTINSGTPPVPVRFTRHCLFRARYTPLEPPASQHLQKEHPYSADRSGHQGVTRHCQIDHISPSPMSTFPLPLPASPRRSFSSDSSDSSTSSPVSNISWGSSSSTMCPTSPIIPRSSPACSHAHELEAALKEKEMWRLKCLETRKRLQEALSYLREDTSIFDDMICEEDHETPVNEATEGDIGHTIVYTNHEVIARDSRFALPDQQTYQLDGILIASPVQVVPGSESSSDGVRREWERQEETRKKRRVDPFPIWTESVPENMLDKRRDMVKCRFKGDPGSRFDRF